MNRADALRQYWRDVKSGARPLPKRKRGVVHRITSVALDGMFGQDRNRRLVLTLHPDGRLELRPERTRRSETIHLLDVYRYAMRCRINRTQREKAREKKERKAIRLAALRQQRAEKRLLL